MAVPIQSRQRTDTPERWHKALGRAISHNLSYMELLGGDGAFAVSSTRDEEQGYVTTSHTCGCEAARGGDPVCLHRALVRALTGIMPVDAEPAPADCAWCNGTGRVDDGYHQHYVTCDSCGGSGKRIDKRLTGQPSVEVVAAAA